MLAGSASDPPASTAPAVGVSSRDVYQAETVRLLRAVHGPDARIVLLQHNGHLQRVPLALMAGVVVRSCGTYLDAEFGVDYRAIGLTAYGGTTTAPRLDGTARHGLVVVDAPLGPPADDSLESAVGPVSVAEVLDVRGAAPGTGPGSIRHAHTHSPVDVVTAFDAVIDLPSTTPSEFVSAACNAAGPGSDIPVSPARSPAPRPGVRAGLSRVLRARRRSVRRGTGAGVPGPLLLLARHSSGDTTPCPPASLPSRPVSRRRTGRGPSIRLGRRDHRQTGT